MAKRNTSQRSHRRRDRACLALAFGSRFLGLSCGELGNELSHKIGSGDVAALVEHQFDYGSYLHPADFALAYQAHSLFKKYPFNGYISEEARVLKAVEKFHKSEASCGTVYSSLRNAYAVTFSKGVTAASIIHNASRKIDALLGGFSFHDILPHVGFGPGASTGHKRSCGDPYYKFGSLPEVTADCEYLMLAAICEFPNWRTHVEQLAGGPIGLGVLPKTPGNRITTVPKDAKSERMIAIEPEGNMFIQKGIGGLIRQRLRKVGIDLNSQLPNQEAARVGSVDGSLATIDLSSASDSISLSLVRELLPQSWVTVIEHSRSQQGILPSGEKILYRKVSSMGNGFTFELESLIFWALASSVLDLLYPAIGSRVLVYGDDIVVASEAAPDVIRVLSHCGFETNADKTFVSGHFRESCGKHYFRGHDVTPVYVRKNVNNDERICWMHNSILQWYHRTRAIFWLSQDEYEYVCSLRHAVNPARRTFIPFAERDSVDFLGDIGLIANFSEALPRRSTLTGSYVAVGYASHRHTKEFDDPSFLYRQLFSLYKRQPFGEEGESAASQQCLADSPVSRVNTLTTGVKRVRLVVHQWADSYLVV